MHINVMPTPSTCLGRAYRVFLCCGRVRGVLSSKLFLHLLSVVSYFLSSFSYVKILKWCFLSHSSQPYKLAHRTLFVFMLQVSDFYRPATVFSNTNQGYSSLNDMDDYRLQITRICRILLGSSSHGATTCLHLPCK